MRKYHLVCVLVVAACATTSRPTDGVERAVTLTVDNPGNGVLVLSRIGAPSAPRRPAAAASELLEATARFKGDALVINFLSPLPTGSQQLVVESDSESVTCTVVPGNYRIATEPPAGDRGATGPSVKSYGSAELTVAAAGSHRRKPSRR